VSEAQCEDIEGKEECSRAVAGLTVGGEQTVRRAASLCLSETRRGMGGRQDSTARMPVGVDVKQLMAPLGTLSQKVLSLEREPALGERDSCERVCLGVLQCMSSVLGMEKDKLKGTALV